MTMMMKKIMQDIVVKKTGAQAPTRTPSKMPEASKLPPVPEKERIIMPPKDSYVPPEWMQKKKSGSSKKWLKGVFILAIIAIIFGGAAKIVSVLSVATIKIVPKQKVLEINTDLTATDQKDGENIYFETADPPQQEGEKIITVSTTKELNQKATGVVAIFNNNSKSQFLVKETRLESPAGKIYKTEKAVTIPANGSIDVNVFADAPGQEYNTTLTDFKLPGFKGNPKYETVIGRSKTEISGGFVGATKVLSAEELNKAKDELKKELSGYLINSIEQSKPADLIAYPGAFKIDFTEDVSNPKEGALGDTFTIKGVATAKVYLLGREELKNKLEKTYESKLTPPNPQGFSVADMDKLDITIGSAGISTSTLPFNIRGEATFVWEIDQNEILAKLTKTSSGAYQEVFKEYPGISTADIIFSPSWWKFIPKDDSRVKFE